MLKKDFIHSELFFYCNPAVTSNSFYDYIRSGFFTAFARRSVFVCVCVCVLLVINCY